jgi:hypothetical protein
LRWFLAALLILLIGISGAAAQNGTQSQLGLPPIASLISISAPDENGLVTISGVTGAVFPGAQIAIRNLYTEQTVYTQGGITGTFSTQIAGQSNTPFWISQATSISQQVRNLPGSLPGGPGTIIYAPFPAAPLTGGPATTQLVIDGDLADWLFYPQAGLRTSSGETLFAIRNQESLYFALSAERIPEAYQNLKVVFLLDDATYELTLNPQLEEQTATLRRVNPNAADLGTIGAAVTQSGAIEIRLPLFSLRSILGASIETASLEQVQFLSADNGQLQNYALSQPIPPVDEIDGIVYSADRLGDDVTYFTTGGPIAEGASIWSADGQINQLRFSPGDTLMLQLGITMNVPGLPSGLSGLSMIGQIILQPVVGADGRQVAGGLNSNNGWSGLLTPSGLAIDNLRNDFVLGETILPSPRVLRRDDQLMFGLGFDIQIPDDFPAGLYVPVFQGYGRIGDGEAFRWEDNGLLGSGPGISRLYINRLPLVLNIGNITEGHLIWSLFQDNLSNGTRGLLSTDDRAFVALSNRVRYNSPTYILPPRAGASDDPLFYPLEPYLINQLPNAYDGSSAPLIPFLFPGGRLGVKITRPDGTVDDLGNMVILQNQLSTVSEDDQVRYGTQSQVDIYRLTTLSTSLNEYRFEQYGPYEIEVAGALEDVWGNRYSGGGTYQLLIAEMLDMMPGVMPGTPFEVGDRFNPGLRLQPGAAADITITVRIYPLDDGAVIEKTITGKANRYGYFHAADGEFQFETPGEYVMDYEARYTDANGRLWAGSLRGAGVIARPNGTLIAHGRRGLGGYANDQRPAWFNTMRYGPGEDEPLSMYYPYYSGDVLWYLDAPNTRINPLLEIQDTGGAYEQWLRQVLPGYRSDNGFTIEQLAAKDSLPAWIVGQSEDAYGFAPERIVNDAYTYLSVNRPGLTVRQYVQGGNDGGLPMYWSPNDPDNQQIGAGVGGEQPGDYVFLFGGAVIRNTEADVYDTAIYAALGIVIDEPSSPLGSRVYPPYRGQAGGPDGGALLTMREQPVNMFFHPTGVQPGQVLIVGDTLAIAGQVAPTLPSKVIARVVNPAGEVTQFQGMASAIGYFYAPENNITVNSPGIWTINITVRHDDLTSAGMVQPPFPDGGVLGAEGRTFSVYVIPSGNGSLTWDDTRQDIAIPGGIPYNFNFTLPDDWTDIQAQHTVTVPGFIVASGTINASGRSFSYQYNPTNLNRSFPNIENDARLDGAAASDSVTLTFVATGQDAAGQSQILTRTFSIMHDRLTTLE